MTKIIVALPRCGHHRRDRADRLLSRRTSRTGHADRSAGSMIVPWSTPPAGTMQPMPGWRPGVVMSSTWQAWN